MIETSNLLALPLALTMLAGLGAAFIAMARFGASQALVLPLLACAFLILMGPAAHHVVEDSFKDFGPVAIVFTAIAVPAHQIQQSEFFRLAGAYLGAFVGGSTRRIPAARTFVLVILTLALTWATAALMHNITAIFVLIPITVAICMSYGVPSRWLLSGELIASNLGGFSTSWGDTPNIIEKKVWGLSNSAFFTEILPLNLVVLAGLAVVVAVLTQRELKRRESASGTAQTAWSIASFKQVRFEVHLDRRRLFVGAGTLIGFLILQFLFHELELAFAAAAILVSTMLDRKGQRLHALQALGLEVYMTLLAVFVVAHCIGQSILGEWLRDLISGTDGAVWAIALSSYFGTGLTEAASWASMAAPFVHGIDPSHASAWALGAGICAGSSSLLTAASAGIILWTETKRFPGHEINFSNYLVFGLIGSVAMLAFYIAAITAIQSMGFWT